MVRIFSFWVAVVFHDFFIMIAKIILLSWSCQTAFDLTQLVDISEKSIDQRYLVASRLMIALSRDEFLISTSSFVILYAFIKADIWSLER